MKDVSELKSDGEELDAEDAVFVEDPEQTQGYDYVLEMTNDDLFTSILQSNVDQIELELEDGSQKTFSNLAPKEQKAAGENSLYKIGLNEPT